MIQIGNKIVSRDLFENHFICQLEKCEGNCCVFGDSGAPLEEDEVELIDKHLDSIKPYMRAEGLRSVHDQGGWVVDNDGDKVTPLVGREECAFVVFEEGIVRCAIEKAYEEGSIPFQKPVSCHLYPIRINRLKNAIALNYHQWSLCEPARMLGKKEGVPVFRFLKDPITRVFGKEFYEELEIVSTELSKKSAKQE
ncbi:MAG: DUF3109 family protein [Bacteroidales bacterium]|nr:DUF3109 family protein [Bacteroidales bacterium]